MLSSLVHPRNLVAALALILAGIAYPTSAAKWSGKEAGIVEGRGEAKVRRGVAPTIGPYRLGMKTADASNLVELTPAEKKALNAAIEFRNERTFRAPSAEFAGATWDMILGAVDDHVYKLSALLVLESREQRDGMWRNLDGTLRTRLGTPAATAATLLAWDTEDGNVVLNRAEAGGAYVVVLTLTSRAVSGFVRVK